MAYCRNCGTQIDDDAAFCPDCGASQGNANPPVVDNGGFLWGLLGCCIPIAGFILFLIWKDTKPKTAKAAGIGVIVGIVLAILGYIVGLVIMVMICWVICNGWS